MAGGPGEILPLGEEPVASRPPRYISPELSPRRFDGVMGFPDAGAIASLAAQGHAPDELTSGRRRPVLAGLATGQRSQEGYLDERAARPVVWRAAADGGASLASSAARCTVCHSSACRLPERAASKASCCMPSQWLLMFAR